MKNTNFGTGTLALSLMISLQACELKQGGGSEEKASLSASGTAAANRNGRSFCVNAARYEPSLVCARPVVDREQGTYGQFCSTGDSELDALVAARIQDDLDLELGLQDGGFSRVLARYTGMNLEYKFGYDTGELRALGFTSAGVGMSLMGIVIQVVDDGTALSDSCLIPE